ncbi:MAG: ketol-acid reductoisomerase [Solirubrobacteraceae bacterium]|nr:ketol-acid reductoisomerase [Solirubrobacteraceae bacterium]
MIYDDDADLHLLDDKTVAIIGYGSQGHAHALNLKDSGVKVVVGLREDSASVAKAREQGLEVLSVLDAASRGDLVMILLPDERHHDIWEQEIRDGVAEGNMILFGHGFSIHYKEIEEAVRRRLATYEAPGGALDIPGRTLVASASA